MKNELSRRNFLKVAGLAGIAVLSFPIGAQAVPPPKREHHAIDLYGGKEEVMKRVREETKKELEGFRTEEGIRALDRCFAEAVKDSGSCAGEVYCMLQNGVYKVLGGERFSMLYFHILNRALKIDVGSKILGNPQFRDRTELAYWNSKKRAGSLKEFLEFSALEELGNYC